MKITPALLRKGFPGLRAGYWPDGGLRVLECYKEGRCVAILELARDDSWGRLRMGIAGEIFQKGTIEPLGPFANDKPRKTGLTLEAWAAGHIRKLQEMAASR